MLIFSDAIAIRISSWKENLPRSIWFHEYKYNCVS